MKFAFEDWIFLCIVVLLVCMALFRIWETCTCPKQEQAASRSTWVDESWKERERQAYIAKILAADPDAARIMKVKWRGK